MEEPTPIRPDIQVDGVTYTAAPVTQTPRYWEHPRTQYCTGCAGQASAELCEKLQRCTEPMLIWKKK